MPVPALFVLIASAAMTLGDTVWHTTLQQQVPANRLSRVSSFDWMVSMLFFPVGAAIAGPMADALGAANAMLVFAVVSTVPCLLVLAFPAVRAITRRERPPEDEELSIGQSDPLELEPKLASAA